MGIGEVDRSSSLLRGEALPLLAAPDFPPPPIEDTEPVDSRGSVRRFVDDLADIDGLPPTPLVAPIEGLVPTEDTETFLVVRVLAFDGGPIDGRLVLREGRVRVVAPAGLVAVDGVPLREGFPLDDAVASCFVGDLVGDWKNPVLALGDLLANGQKLFVW